LGFLEVLKKNRHRQPGKVCEMIMPGVDRNVMQWKAYGKPSIAKE
jgi:hypothetical protein